LKSGLLNGRTSHSKMVRCAFVTLFETCRYLCLNGMSQADSYADAVANLDLPNVSARFGFQLTGHLVSN
jgi:hypothetical protein